MRVLIVGPVPPGLGSKNTGGIARHVWALANKLKKKGHDVSVLAIGRYFKGMRVIDGITVFGADNPIRGLGSGIINAPSLFSEIGFIPQSKSYFHAFHTLSRLYAVKDPDQYDIIHLHGLHNAGLYAFNILDVKTPKIVSIHSYTGYISPDESRSMKKISHVSNYLDSADGVVHVSNADKKKGRRYGLDFGKEETVIHNGLEKGGDALFDSKAGICFVGYLIESKRISLFLKSLSHTKSDIHEITIAGDGFLKQEVENVAESNPIISYRGVIPNEEVRKMMRDNSLLVVPSVSESFGLVYIEALFEGMAVLGYAPVINEFREVMNLTEVEKKLVVPVEPVEMSPEELARKIDAAFEFRQSHAGKETMKQVQQKAIQHFEWEAVIDKITDFYRQVIDH